MPLNQIQNLEPGLTVREKLNTLIDYYNSAETLPSDFNAHINDFTNPHRTSWETLLNIPPDFPPALHSHDSHSGITADNHHNQVHLLYGGDHDDVNSDPAINITQGLFHNGTKFELAYRTNYVEWSPGPTYYPQQMVYVDDYLSLCLTPTDEYPVPQRVGNKVWLYTGSSPTAAATAKAITFGQRYSWDVDTFFSAYSVYTVIGNDYIVYSVKDPQGAKIIQQEFQFTATTTGKREFTVPETLIEAGAELDLMVTVSEPDATPTTVVTSYNYLTPQNLTVPATGTISHSRGQPDIMRVHETDFNAVDRTGMLAALTPGDQVNVGGNDYSIQSTVDNGLYWQLVVAPAIVGAEGLQDATFETVTPTPITRLEDVNWWGNNPPANGTIQGMYIEDGSYDDIVPDTNAYGVDLFLQLSTQSAQWKIIGKPGGSGGGGGTFTPSIFAGAGSSGYVPDPVTEQAFFLRDDGSFRLPVNTDIRSPAGGTIGQILAKVSGTDHDTEWIDESPGVTDHGALTGLSDDDHTQYHTDARGDLRYAPISHTHPLTDLPIDAGTSGGQTLYWQLNTARWQKTDNMKMDPSTGEFTWLQNGTFDKELLITGLATLTTGANVNGKLNANASLSVVGNFDVSGGSTLTGNVNLKEGIQILNDKPFYWNTAFTARSDYITGDHHRHTYPSAASVAWRFRAANGDRVLMDDGGGHVDNDNFRFVIQQAEGTAGAELLSLAGGRCRAVFTDTTQLTSAATTIIDFTGSGGNRGGYVGLVGGLMSLFIQTEGNISVANTSRVHFNANWIYIGDNITTTPTTAQNGFRFDSTNSQLYTYKNTTANAWAHVFNNPNGTVGVIATNGSTTIYNTSSDYRLKEVFGPVNDQLAILNALTVHNGYWKSDPKQRFQPLVLAHELDDLFPDVHGLVSGEKNGEEMQMADLSKLIPTLIAAIQDLNAKVDDLEYRLLG